VATEKWSISVFDLALVVDRDKKRAFCEKALF
jgi:hypothetical protein